MDPRSVTLCLLHTALKWPHRLDAALQCVQAPLSPDPIYGAIWNAVMTVKAINRRMPPAPEFRAQVLTAIQMEAPAYSGNAASWLSQVAESRTPTEEFCFDRLRQYAKQRLFDEIPNIDSAAEEQRLRDRLEALDHLTSGPVLPNKIDLFADEGRALLRAEVIERTGMFLLDEPFGGLFPRGRLVLFVIPTKTGKTLLSLQISKQLVELGKSVVYMNFEQEAAGDLATRIYMMITDTPKSTWTSVRSFTDLPEAVRLRLEHRRPNWEERFHPYSAESFEDPNTLNRGADSLHLLLRREFLDLDRPVPDLIIIDWWKELWERCLVSLKESGLVRTEKEERLQELQHLKKIKLMAQALDTRALVMMQMRSAILGTPAALNIDKLSSFDAAENKALANYADACMVSTKRDPKDPSGKVQFKLDLCRWDRPGWIGAATTDGEYQLFTEVRNDPGARAANIESDDGGLT